MAWTDVVSRTAGQKLPYTFWNTYVRDNLLMLKSNVRDDGTHDVQLKGIGFGSGQGNTGGGEDELTSYTFSIPANFLAEAGDALVVETLFVIGTGDTKTIKLYVGGGSAVALWAATTDTILVGVRVVITRRGAASGSCCGIVTSWVAGSPATLSTLANINADLGTVDWTTAQNLKWTAESSSSTNNDAVITDLEVHHLRGYGRRV